MEQIVRRDGQIYYGRIRCMDADDAYSKDYLKKLNIKEFFQKSLVTLDTKKQSIIQSF